VGCDRGSSGIEGRQEEQGEGGGGHVQKEEGEGQAVMAGPRDAFQQRRKQGLRPAWLMCAKTLPLAGLSVPT
jgi:hypothetical protein